MNTKPPDGNNPDELLAVVNECDEEIGAEKRHVIHESGLLHRAVHVLIFDGDGDLLTQKRSAKKDTFPLHWECVGGHLGSGEEYAIAASREVEEELGVKAIGPELLCKIAASKITGLEFVAVYRTEIEGKLRPDEREVTQVEWVSLPDLKNMIQYRTRDFSPSFVNTLRNCGLI